MLEAITPVLLTLNNFSVRISYENAGLQTLDAGVTPLGYVFSPGELKFGQGLTGLTGGQTVAVQVDVKTTYADGSAKMAILTMARPTLAAGASAEVVLTATPGPSGASLDFAAGLTQHNFSVALTGTDGQIARFDVIAALKAAMASGEASFWQVGPMAVQARVEIPLDGSQRMIFDVTLFKGGGLNVEAQFNNDGAMGAVGGRVAHTVAVTMDGVQVAQASLNQGQYQNWHQSFSSNGRDGGQGLGGPAEGWLNIRQDIAHLQATGAVANYDLSRGVDSALLDAWGTAAAAPGWDEPLGTRGVTQYMPGTGGRADIGFTTEANTGWLMTQDARAASYAMGQAEAASAAPWHLWDAQNGTWLGTAAYPNLWTDGRGGTGTPGNANSGGLTQQPDQASGWTLDTAHQPALSYVPYLMTGERWMLDNIQAQASWNLMSQWPAIRNGAEDLLVKDNQVRGAAWSLRQIDEAAWASPNGSAEKAAFSEASAANWSWLVAQIPRWTAQQGEAHGWIPGDYGSPGALPPWQQDYFASTAIAAARLGNADALTFLTWQSNFLVGRFTHEAEGFAQHDGAAYLIAIADQTTGALYTTWAQIGAQTAARNWSNGDGWSHSQGDYPQLALATLAGIAAVLGSSAAANAYAALLADNPPFTASADYTRDPTFAIAAPGTGTAPPPKVPVQAVLSIVLGAEIWQGNPEALVLVNGVEAFRGEISALHATGGAEIALGTFSTSSTFAITVRFLNDGWGGTASTDRNLFVEDLLVNGISMGKSAALLAAGEVAFIVSPPVVVIPPPAPIIPSTGAGANVIRVGLSGDAWEGSPRFLILLDGVAVADWVADASHGQGRVGYFDVRADLGTAAHAITIRFMNDAFGGSAAADRNLYVNSLSIDGVDQNWKADLLSNRDATFTIAAAIRVIDGTSAADVLRGTAGVDWISGFGGDDTLSGGMDDDVLAGGVGIDRFEVDAGIDSVMDLGLGGADVLIVSAGASAAATLGGSWTATASSSNAGHAGIAAAGFSVNLSLAGGSQGWSVSNAGIAIAVNIAGSIQGDTLVGGNGNDTLTGGAGDDMMSGGAGLDRFSVDAGADTILDLGLGGHDLLMISTGATASATLVDAWTAASGTSNAGVASLLVSGFDANLAAATGTNGWSVSNAGQARAVTLTGSGKADLLTGGEGHDSLIGNAGADTLTGGAGNDTLLGGAGMDSLIGGTGNDVLTGGSEADRFVVDAGEDMITDLGLGGADALVISAAAVANATLGSGWVASSGSSNAGQANLFASGFNVNLGAAGGTAGWSVSNTASTRAVSLTGSGNGDRLTGGSGADTIAGGLGSDTLSGGDGNDRLSGDAGDDLIIGGLGIDRFVVNLGVDTVSDLGLGGADSLVVSAGARVQATLAADWVATSGTTNSGIANLMASGFDVNLTAAAGSLGWNVSNDGQALAVSFLGSGRADVLTGGAAGDTLLGGAGNDTLCGGLGADRLTGGQGADTFLFRGAADARGDVILDFSAGQGDRIDLRSIDANAAMAGDQAFIFIGASAFSAGTAGQLRFAQGVLQGDLGGDGIADFQMELVGTALITASQIWL